MDLTKLLDDVQTIKTEEDIREICYTANIPRENVKHRDLVVTDFKYNLDSEIVLHTLGVMLETSDAELWIDVIGDNSRQKSKHKFTKDQNISWSYPYKAHNLHHGKIAIREYFIEIQTYTNGIDQIASHNIQVPTVLSKQNMLAKFSHDFDHEYLKHIEQLEPDTRDFSDLRRLDSKHILINNGQCVRGDRNTAFTYRTEFLKIPEFRQIWNRSLEFVAGARNLELSYDDQHNVISHNTMLIGPFVLDFNDGLNGELFDVTIWIPEVNIYYDESQGVYKKQFMVEDDIPCGAVPVGLVLYLPTSAKHDFHIAAYVNQTQHRSLWEHTVYPGEAVFISNKMKYELLHFDTDLKIHGFNVVSYCPSELIERLLGHENEVLKEIRQEMINS